MLKRYGVTGGEPTHYNTQGLNYSLDDVTKRDTETQMTEEMIREPSFHSMEGVATQKNHKQEHLHILLRPVRGLNMDLDLS